MDNCQMEDCKHFDPAFALNCKMRQDPDDCDEIEFEYTQIDTECDPEDSKAGVNIHQPKPSFDAITITLNTRQAARDFFSLVMKLESYLNNVDSDIKLTKLQTKLLVKLCDADVVGVR